MGDKLKHEIIKVVQNGMYAAVETRDDKGYPLYTKLVHHTALTEELVDEFQASRGLH